MTWNWSTQKEEKYDLFPLREEEEEQVNKVQEEATTPPLLLTYPIQKGLYSSSSLERNSSERPRRLRSL